ncbi:MAG TPA: GTPase HflX [Bacillota bacterium]|nr:GTPase HflX [Bacillota bacterium]
MLVGLERAGERAEFAASMDELALLAKTAGAEVVGTVAQRREAPDPAYYIGLGKAQELGEAAAEAGADLVIFDNELSPSQVRNLDRILGVKTVDRTALILDIFARRARSREGKLQVELAQLQYLLPRLAGLGEQLSRLGGGIGTRGPGETQLEVDRRAIRRRIGDLQREISSLRRHRALHRQKRRRNRVPVAGLVGYTNAGKSTLANALTGADLYTEDKLFATLDPTVRRGRLEDGRVILFADTVGFIRHLPRQLLAAFQATLEEITAADILLHVVDISHPQYPRQIEIVRRHLSRLDPGFERRELLVFNKIDLRERLEERPFLEREYPRACFVSAKEGRGLAELKEALARILDEQGERVHLCLPYGQEAILEQIRRRGNILRLHYRPQGTEVEALVDPALSRKLLPYSRIPEREGTAEQTAEAEAGDA